MFTMEKIKIQIDSYEEEDNEMCQSQHQEPFEAQNITQSLNSAKTKFIEFVQHLGQFRTTQIRADIMAHCEQINRNKKIISMSNSPQTILKLITCRIDKMLKNKKIKKNWSQEDIKILVWIVSKYSDKHGIQNIEKQLTSSDWNNIACLIPGVKQNNCMYRWLSLKKVNLSNKSWTQEQSRLLETIIHGNLSMQPGKNILTGANWRQISQNLYQENNQRNKVYRSPKQCKQHWNCFLNPKLKKGPWQTQEDILLLSLIQKNRGLKRWSQIVQCFQGRTQNALKNRYNLLLQKQKRLNRSNKNEMSLITEYLDNYNAKFLSAYNESIDKPELKMLDKEKQSKQMNNYNENDQLYQEGDNQSNKKSQSVYIQSTSSTVINQLNSPLSSTKIHFLSAYQQFEFLSWIKQRTDVKKCCLKNGAFQIQE